MTAHEPDEILFRDPRTVWEFVEDAHGTWAEPLADLWNWGLNCDDKGNPWSAFLDLTGISADLIGCAVFPWHLDPVGLNGEGWSFGYMEIDYLTDALRVFANRPSECAEWVRALMDCEG